MITALPFRLGDAPALAEDADPFDQARIVLIYTRLRRTAPDHAGWAIDGELAIHAATVDGWSRGTTPGQMVAWVEAHVARLDQHFRPQPGACEMFVYARREVLPVPGLSGLETAYLDAVSSHPDLFDDDSPVPGLAGNPATGTPAWSPSDYARALHAARHPDPDLDP